MNLSPLYITFGQHQVAVETAIVDVHFTLMRWFYAMLSPQPSFIVRQVTIFQSDGNYIIKSDQTVHDPIREQFWLLQAVKYEIVMGLVRSRPDLLWFHAAAVAFDTGVCSSWWWRQKYPGCTTMPARMALLVR
jgi:hypothetical protein